MSYPINTTIPNVNNFPGDDAPLMQVNFANINSYLGVDHVLPGAAGNGHHKQVTFNAPLGSDPATPIDDTAYLYTKLINSIPQLVFLNKSGNTTNASANGSVTLFGGIILKWGSYTGGSGTITFPSAFPNNCFAVLMQPIGTNATIINDYVYVANVSASGFTATGTRRTQLISNSINAYYFAIGN